MNTITKCQKKEYFKDIKKAKNSYYGEEIFKAQKNTRKMWNIINSLIQNKSRSSPIISIKYNDKTIVDSQEIAEISF